MEKIIKERLYKPIISVLSDMKKDDKFHFILGKYNETTIRNSCSTLNAINEEGTFLSTRKGKQGYISVYRLK